MSVSPLFYLLVAAALAAPIYSAADPLRFVTEENPPYNYASKTVDGIAGISTDVVAEAARRANVPVVFERYPWARAYWLAQHEANVCIYSTVRSPERENQFRWLGPIAFNRWALFSRSDFPHVLKSLQDARRFTIGGAQQDARALYLRGLGYKVDAAPDDKLNPRKLQAKRIDLWVAGLYKGRSFAAEQGVIDIKPVLVFHEVEYYLACNLKIDDTIYDKLASQFDALRSENYLNAYNTPVPDDAKKR